MSTCTGDYNYYLYLFQLFDSSWSCEHLGKLVIPAVVCFGSIYKRHAPHLETEESFI